MRGALVLALLVACGDGAAPSSDAASGRDASDDDLVRIAFTGWTTNEGHRVLFQDADSSVTLVTLTDSQGHANARMKPGGSVTVIDDSLLGQRTILTRTDVPAGRVVAIGVPGTVPAHTHYVQLSIAPPAGASDDTQYILDAPCIHQNVTSAVDSPLLLDLSDQPGAPRCPDVSDLLLSAFPPSGQVYAAESAVALGTGQPVAVHFTGPYQPAMSVPVTIRGPVENPVDNNLIVSHGLIATAPMQWSVSLNDPVTSRSVLEPVIAGLTARTQIQPSISFSHGLIDWAPVTPQVDIDYASLAFAPQTQNARYALTGRSVPSIAWEDGEGMHGEIIAGDVLWSIDGNNTSWYVLGPRDGDSPALALPRLPSSVIPTASPVSLSLYELHVVNDASAAIDDVLAIWRPSTEWRVQGERGRVVWRYLRSSL